MKIINPLYDQAFKYMMDNEQIAKKILALILEKEIISLQSKPQEVKTYDPKREIPLSRFDFKAIIRDADNKQLNVLIEIQKSKSPDPIMRFRRYLGKNYIKQETFIDADGIESTEPLPIITIYFLGYNLDDYDTPSIVVNNVVTDTVNNCVINYKDKFVELLTHPSYILQINRLKKSRKTRIEKFLAIFDQGKISDSRYILDIDESSDDQDITSIQQYLHRATQDEDMILKLELEEDVEKEFQLLEQNLENALAEKERERAEKERERAEKENAIAEKEKALSSIFSIIKNLQKSNLSAEQISIMTNLSVDEVKKILGE